MDKNSLVKKILRISFVVCVAIFLTSCATAPLRKINISNKITQNKILSSLKVAILPIEGMPSAAKFVRKSLHVNLMKTDMKIIEKFLVDGALKKNRWNKPVDFAAIPPQKLGEAFGADALLYGNISEWKKFYAIIYSKLTVGLELKLVDARTGELLWKGEESATESEGLFKIPTGIISIFTAPLFYAAKEDNMKRLARKVARNITSSLRKSYKAKEEDRMYEKIVVASAKEYLKKIENNIDDQKQIALKSPNLQNKQLIKTASNNILNSVKNGYTIQVGAFQNKLHADKLIEKLTDKGFNSYLVLSGTGAELLYKVQIYRFKSRKEAIYFAKKLKEKINLSYFITKAKAVAKT